MLYPGPAMLRRFPRASETARLTRRRFASRRRFVSRRQFVSRVVGWLVLALAGVGAIATGGASRRAKASAALGDRVRGLFADPRHARAIGAKHLASSREAGTQSLGLARALRTLPGRDDVRRALRERTRSDWERGDVVVIDGWILASTEAQVCALTVLL